jgi:cell wall assembly regulator SMI1
MDGGGNGLAVDLDPQPGGQAGQVIFIGPDEDTRHVVATSISDLLERLVSEWHGGRVLIEDSGDGERSYDPPLLRGQVA